MFTGETELKNLQEVNELYHHGVKGQKWGVQNGPPYPIDRNAVFVSGSSKTQDKESGYYRKNLPKDVSDALDSYIDANRKIVVGDAPGIDRQVQDYLNTKDYKNVEVFGPGKEIRYIANPEWKKTLVDVPDAEPGSKEWLKAKDIAMEKVASEGLAVILDEGSNATRNNIDRLISNNKTVKVYQLNPNEEDDDFIDFKHSDHLEHHGILGQKWGDQNGPPYPLNPSQKSYSEKKQAKMDKKWIRKNDKKIRRYADSQSKEELKAYEKELRKVMPKYNKNGKINSNYATAYSKKMADLYNKAIGDLAVGSGSGSGKVVKFVAARGQMDVFTALADYGYDMSNVRNGVYDSGRIGYRKESVGVDRDERK